MPEGSQFDTVCKTDEEAATIAANTIIKYNKKNILALFSNPELSITKKRKEAFLRTLEREKDKLFINIHYCNSSIETQELISGIISSKPLPDHVFCMSDELLVGVMKSINHSNIRVPEEISILAISNGFIPRLFKPKITYVETSGKELGRLVTKRMLELMEDKGDPKSIILPARLVPGKSL